MKIGFHKRQGFRSWSSKPLSINAAYDFMTKNQKFYDQKSKIEL